MTCKPFAPAGAKPLSRAAMHLLLILMFAPSLLAQSTSIVDQESRVALPAVSQPVSHAGQNEKTHIWMEAEEGVDPNEVAFQVTRDAKAFGGRFVEEPAGYSKWKFQVTQSGRYRLHGRFFASDGNNDSFIVRLLDSAGEEITRGTWDNINSAARMQWHWDSLDYKNKPYDIAQWFDLSPGQYTLEMLPRDANALKVDKFVLSPHEGFDPQSDRVEPESGEIEFEAESAEVTPPFSISSNEQALMGKYVSMRPANATYSFNIDTAGEYRILGRVRGENGKSDSMMVELDGLKQPTWKFANSKTWSQEWQWVTYRTGESKTIHFDAGKHVLKLKQRETRAAIDVIVVTNDSDYVPPTAPKSQKTLTTTMASSPRPNIVFMYTDDQRHDCLGVVQREQGERGRWPWFKTPHLDHLADTGLRFRNAFVVHSLCTPSRASFLTGQYTHRHRVMGNFTNFPSDANSYGSILSKSGYQTAYIGKWHMGRKGGKRPGFTYTASYPGQGQYFDCPFDIQGRTTQTAGWVDDVATDYAIDFMRRNQEAPFCLTIGFKSPHSRFDPPPRLQETFAGKLLTPPVSFNVRPIYLGKVHAADPAHMKTGGNRPPGDPLNYFRTIAGVDENVGRVLNALKELNLSDNTLVIFSSDNGYQFGDHAIGDKRSAYEESIRIPMLVRYPRQANARGTSDALALNIDVAPTILDVAGVKIPESMQGKSWKPLLEGEAQRVRDDFLYEYFYSYPDITDYEIQTADPPITPTMVAVRTETTKLITYPGHTWLELFDLKNDPYELSNLASDPQHAELLQSMQSRLTQVKDRVQFQIPPEADEVPEDAITPRIHSFR